MRPIQKILLPTSSSLWHEWGSCREFLKKRSTNRTRQQLWRKSELEWVFKVEYWSLRDWLCLQFSIEAVLLETTCRGRLLQRWNRIYPVWTSIFLLKLRRQKHILYRFLNTVPTSKWHLLKKLINYRKIRLYVSIIRIPGKKYRSILHPLPYLIFTLWQGWGGSFLR